MKNWMEQLVRVLPVVALVGVVLGGLHFTQAQLNRIRTEKELTMAAPLENAPPVVAFTTVALGGFRGLVADWLWLRSRRLQEEGSFFEMVQLADWIVKLQPRFTGATAFLAWNMSYNISVTFSDFEDRWRWVQRGIELIRDEALQYNPGDPDLYQELAWIYRHKVGQKMDDANRYYKTQMARDIMRIYGGDSRPDWQVWQNTPAELDALKERLGAESPLLRALENRQMSLRSLEESFRIEGALPSELDAIHDVEQDLRLVERAFRVRWLYDEYKIRPALIRELNRKHGELDWRLPQAHAIYWAHKGLQLAEGEVHANCERIITHSLKQAFYEGRLLYVREGEEEFLDLAANIHVVDAVLARHRQNIANHPDNRGFRSGFENFLIDAVVVLFTYGEEATADRLLQEGGETFGRKFRGSVEQFALRHLAEDLAMATQAQAAATVRGYLYQACRALAFGDFERAGHFDHLAHAIWRKYMSETGRTERQRQRTGLPPYPQMKQKTIDMCLQQFPPALSRRLKGAVKTLLGEEAPSS